jgi:cupin fold WbuC family metalloprotein
MESEHPRLVSEPQLAQLAAAAAASARRRSHILLHADHQDQVQRLLIALEPDSYVRPHLHSEQWEMIVLLRGGLDLLIFTPQAELTQRLAMSAASPVVQIPRGTWHGGVALASQTLVLEVKPGPYRPNEFAEWALQEGEAASAAFVRWARGADLGAKWQDPCICGVSRSPMKVLRRRVAANAITQRRRDPNVWTASPRTLDLTEQ